MTFPAMLERILISSIFCSVQTRLASSLDCQNADEANQAAAAFARATLSDLLCCLSQDLPVRESIVMTLMLRLTL